MFQHNAENNFNNPRKDISIKAISIAESAESQPISAITQSSNDIDSLPQNKKVSTNNRQIIKCKIMLCLKLLAGVGGIAGISLTLFSSLIFATTTMGIIVGVLLIFATIGYIMQSCEAYQNQVDQLREQKRYLLSDQSRIYE